MIRQFRIAASAVVVSMGLVACDGHQSSSPMGPSTAISGAGSAARSSRDNVVRVTKECSTYTGHAGDICTITSSNFKGIKAGSRVVYASDAAANGWLDTDIVIDPPGRGRDNAVGHCALDLVTGDGQCTVTGRIGKFEEFQATVVVSHLDGPNYAWNGTYRVTSRHR
jgi:hypothetical protein